MRQTREARILLLRVHYRRLFDITIAFLACVFVFYNRRSSAAKPTAPYRLENMAAAYTASRLLECTQEYSANWFWNSHSVGACSSFVCRYQCFLPAALVEKPPLFAFYRFFHCYRFRMAPARYSALSIFAHCCTKLACVAFCLGANRS